MIRARRVDRQECRPAKPFVTAGAPRMVGGRPLLTFSLTAIGLTWSVQFTFLALGWPLFPALVIELGILLGTATLMTRRMEGQAGVRRLYATALRWRFGARWYALILVLLPLATVTVAAASGTLAGPSDGWGLEVFQYLFLTLVFGALLGNVWEELAWTGFMQERVTARHGLLKGALLTALPFGLIHLPLAFEQDGLTGTSLPDLALTWALLLAVAPFFRYLIGVVHARTGRSVLAVAILHGSFNACASTSLATGGWEYIAAAVAATIVVALAYRASASSRLEREIAARARWVSAPKPMRIRPRWAEAPHNQERTSYEDRRHRREWLPGFRHHRSPRTRRSPDREGG